MYVPFLVPFGVVHRATLERERQGAAKIAALNAEIAALQSTNAATPPATDPVRVTCPCAALALLSAYTRAPFPFTAPYFPCVYLPAAGSSPCLIFLVPFRLLERGGSRR